MPKQATLKSLLEFYLVVLCSTNHLAYGANSENSPDSEPAGSENSEKPEFENCILLQGDISREDPFLNNAINQLFMVIQT